MYDLIFVLTWCSLQDPVKPSEQLKYFFCQCVLEFTQDHDMEKNWVLTPSCSIIIIIHF